jgi:hypothetical protein
MFGFFSEYEVQSQVTSLMSVLKAAAAIVSKSNSGECDRIVEGARNAVVTAFAQLEQIFNAEEGAGKAGVALEMDEILFDERCLRMPHLSFLSSLITKHASNGTHHVTLHCPEFMIICLP